MLWLSWAVVVVAGAAVIFVMRRRHRRERTTLETQIDALGQQIEKIAADGRAELTRLQDVRAREKDALEVVIADARAEGEASRRFLARSLRWDQISHDEITAACARLGIPGVLASNLVFRPEDSRDRTFVAQIDHVLLTPHGAAVIESKYWKGVVFDGIRPHEVHPTLAALIRTNGLTSPFAIHVTEVRELTTVRHESGPEERVSLKLEPDTYTGVRAPANQVRRQAQRLNVWCHSKVQTRVPWFETCVFYSHPDAVVHAKPVDHSSNGAHTTIAAGRNGLEAFLRRFAPDGVVEHGIEAEQLAKLTELFEAQGAMIEPLKTHA